jgi:hypothetical protein
MPISTLFKLRSLLLIACLWFFNQTQVLAQGNYKLSTFDYKFCISSYPAAYVKGSFSITETSQEQTKGFVGNQKGKTFVLKPSAGFEFKPGAGTVTCTGNNGIIIDSSSITKDSIIATITTTQPSSTELNSIYFTDIEVRPTSSSATSGTIFRDGGDFRIDQSTTKPSKTEPFSTMSSATPFTYSSSSVTQASTAGTSQYSINNEILSVKISGSGSCGTSVTNFKFNIIGDDGTNLPSNITVAKIYYTGSSNIFSSTNYVGEVASPNGEFVISSNQALANGDNYFWLTYDIAGDANTGTGYNKIDAQLVSFDLNNVTYTDATDKNPAGSRTIVPAEFYYTIASGNWSDNNIWSNTESGTTCNCQPNGSGVAVIRHGITLDTDRTVSALEIRDGGKVTSTSSTLTTEVLNTIGSGYFDLSGPLTLNGNLTLSGSGSSFLRSTSQISIGGVLDIGTGTMLTRSGNILTLNGNINVNGSLAQSTSLDVVSGGGTAYISGNGTLQARNFIIKATGKTVPSTSSLTFNSSISIDGVSIENYGSVTINSLLDGTTSSSVWRNMENSTLLYAGSTKMFNTAGKLEASATGNTVNYSRIGDQMVILPSNGNMYHHLTLSGSGVKAQQDGILYIKGNFTNNLASGSSFSQGNINKIVFKGTASQTIGGSLPTTFTLVEIDNTSGSGIDLSTNQTITGKLTFTNGLVNTGSNTVIITNTGTGTVSGAGAGKYVNGNLRKSFTSSVLTRTFEVGSNGDYTPATVAFSSLTTAGTLTVSSNHGDHAEISSSCINYSKSVNKNWTISNTGSAIAGTYSATFNFVSGNIDAGAATGSFRVARYNASLSPAWGTQTAGTAGTTSTQATGISTFGDFQVGELAGTASVTITSDPVSASICAGKTITFSISAASGLGSDPTYQWQLNGADINGATASTYSTNTLLDTDQISLIATPGASNCGSTTPATSNVITVAVDPINQWIGTTTDWHTASNWCGDVPTSASTVLIPAGASNMPVISSTAEVKDITVESGATVTINGTLSVNGSYAGTGLLIGSSTGALSINGSDGGVPSALYFEETANTLHTLTINRSDAGSKVILGSNLSIGNKLDLLNGDLEVTEGFALNFKTTASDPAESPASKIIGTAVMEARTVGKGNLASFLGVAIDPKDGETNVADVGDITITRATNQSATYETNEGIKVIWDIQSSVPQPFSSDTNKRLVTFKWLRFWDNGKFNEVAPEVWRRIDPGSPWEKIVLVEYDSTATTRSLAFLTEHFSEWTVSDENAPLPISLHSLQARPAGNEVELSWTTASEVNNKLFSIERSADGKIYEVVLEKDGAGNSNQHINYLAYDRNPIYGLSYYRLKQTDFDGTYSYSEAVVVNFKGGKTTELAAFPNPNSGEKINLILRGLKNQKVTIQVTNLLGSIIHTEKADIDENNSKLEIEPVTKLRPGVYSIIIKSNTTSLYQRIVVR